MPTKNDHTSIYKYDKDVYQYWTLIAKAINKSTSKFLWDELHESISMKYPSTKSLEDILHKRAHDPPSIFAPRNVILKGLKSMNLSELDRLDKKVSLFSELIRIIQREKLENGERE